MHISPSQSDHAEDEAQFHSLIPEGDDEAERECLDGGRRSLSCHADQGKVHTYRVKIVERCVKQETTSYLVFDLHLLAT